MKKGCRNFILTKGLMEIGNAFITNDADLLSHRILHAAGNIYLVFYSVVNSSFWNLFLSYTLF